jgi:serine phosphatase RsbU (regulator of sigma subunit)/FixJ family two-component response regulator
MKSVSKSIILCVDDEKTILDSLEEQIIRHMGKHFDCEVCQGAEEALEALDEFEEEGRNVAVIVSDQLMPGMKGDEFLIRVHARYPETLKILLTGQANLEHIRNAINKARLYRYVNKPWQQEDLMMTIEEAARSYNTYLELAELNHLLRTLNKAMQEISGEMLIDQLIPKLMKSVAESSGAERGFLVLRLMGQPMRLITSFSVIEEENRRLQSRIQEDSDAFTEEILRLIEEVKDLDPSTSYRLGIPIPKQGNLLGYFYVENPLTRNPFDENQHEILSTLASQAAISLENSQLLASLEEKTEELRKERNRVIEVNRLIEEKTNDITDSIRYAQRIQNSILPPTQLLQQYIPESFVFHRAKDIVSGDFYWWHNEPERFMVAAVDCTGHGVPGAFMSVIGSNFLNQIVGTPASKAPHLVLNALNDLVRRSLKQDLDAATTRDGMDLALCILDRPSRKLYFAGAYRPLYLVRNADIIEITGTKFSIAGTQFDGMEIEFQTNEIELELGDMVYICSDGYADQFGGPSSKKLSTRRFRQLLTQIYMHPMQIQTELLQHTFEKWKGDLEQTDDVLVIGMRFTEACFVVTENLDLSYV